MIRKITAYSFILLASLFLLAHAVIPHHHHLQQVCIEAKHNHHHDGNDDYNNSCILSGFVPAPDNKTYKICNCQQSGDNHVHDFLFVIFTDNNVISAQVIKTESPGQEFIPLYTSGISSLFGLRAPPTV